MKFSSCCYVCLKKNKVYRSFNKQFPVMVIDLAMDTSSYDVVNNNNKKKNLLISTCKCKEEEKKRVAVSPFTYNPCQHEQGNDKEEPNAKKLKHWGNS